MPTKAVTAARFPKTRRRIMLFGLLVMALAGGAVVWRLEPPDTAITREWPTIVRTDTKKGTITVALDGVEMTLPVRRDVKVKLFNKEAALKDIEPGMQVELRAGPDEGRVAVTEANVILGSGK